MLNSQSRSEATVRLQDGPLPAPPATGCKAVSRCVQVILEAVERLEVARPRLRVYRRVRTKIATHAAGGIVPNERGIRCSSANLHGRTPGISHGHRWIRWRKCMLSGWRNEGLADDAVRQWLCKVPVLEGLLIQAGLTWARSRTLSCWRVRPGSTRSTDGCPRWSARRRRWRRRVARQRPSQVSLIGIHSDLFRTA